MAHSASPMTVFRGAVAAREHIERAVFGADANEKHDGIEDREDRRGRRAGRASAADWRSRRRRPHNWDGADSGRDRTPTSGAFGSTMMRVVQRAPSVAITQTRKRLKREIDDKRDRVDRLVMPEDPERHQPGGVNGDHQGIMTGATSIAPRAISARVLLRERTSSAPRWAVTSARMISAAVTPRAAARRNLR